MKKLLICTITAMFCAISLYAQQKITVSGTVYDGSAQAGNELPGTVVATVSNSANTITDGDGKFIISANPGDNLVFSFMGYEQVILPVEAGKVYNVVLQMSSTLLNETLITGYQTISKERATGSYDILSDKVLDAPSSNISQRLIGKVTGLATNLDSEGNASFVIRGQSTFLGTEPLLVVDGFAIDGGFDSINPNDVESVTVLKDAAASSIWGSRASNGVIVITTKKSNSGQNLKVNFSSFVRIGSRTDIDYLRNTASSAEQIEWNKKYMSGNYGYSASIPNVDPEDSAFSSTAGYSYTQAQAIYNQYKAGEISESQMNSSLNKLASLDNTKQIRDSFTQIPVYQQYSLSFAGGSQRMSNYVSMLYSTEKNRFKGNSDYNMQFNYRGTMNIFKWLDLNINATMKYSKADNSGAKASYITSLAPYDMIYDESGKLCDMSYLQHYADLINHSVPKDKFPYGDWSYNPVTEMDSSSLISGTLYNRLQAGLTFKILPGLTFDSKFQYEYSQQNTRNLYGENSWLVRNTVNKAATWDLSSGTITSNIPSGAILDESCSTVNSYDWRNQITFDRTFGNDHNISAIAGLELIQSKIQKHTSPRAYGYDDDHLTVGTFPNGAGGSGDLDIQNWLGYSQTFSYLNSYAYNLDRYFSVYANLAYTYKGKYTLSGSVRNDASNFITDDPAYRYSPFWSVGASWLASSEDFFNSDAIDYLKIRATYGYNGNSDSSTSVKPLISMDGINASTGYMEASIYSKGNPLLRWERTGTFNLGADFDLWNSKLYGKVDYYNRHSYDILADVSIARVFGDYRARFNNAEIQNNGIELELGSRTNIGPVRYNVEARFSYNSNLVKSLYVDEASYWILVGSGGSMYVEGKPINAMYSYKYAGIQNFGSASSPRNLPAIKLVEDGEYMPVIGGSTTYDGLDFCEYQGTQVAPVYASLTNDFAWKQFDLTFTLTGKFGHVFRRTGYNYASGIGAIPNSQYSKYINSDPDEIVPIFIEGESSLPSSSLANYMNYLTTNAMSIRLQELTLAYSLPSRLFANTSISQLKFYLQGNNLFTIACTKEDPDYRYGSLRLLPSYTIGVKLDF